MGDHPPLDCFLEAAGEVLEDGRGTADGNETVIAARRLRPDVVLMDLQMPNSGGVAATARIVDEQPDVRVLILTTTTTHRTSGRLRAGADGYLLIDTPREELFAAIRHVAAGGSALSPGVAANLETTPAPVAILTEREVEVLQHIADGASNPRRRRRPVHQRSHRQDPPDPHLRQARRLR